MEISIVAYHRSKSFSIFRKTPYQNDGKIKWISEDGGVIEIDER